MQRPPSKPPDIPGYTYAGPLGSGGFSDVYLYDQKLPKRRVAVKVLLTEGLTAATRAAFVDEANLMAQFSDHPNIVTIYQADVTSDDRPYFVMEYCSGPSLADRYKQGPMSVVDVLQTGIRISSAVATAHAAGILHRDIKPGNVLTNSLGRPALTDFGISSALEDEIPTHTTTITRGGSATSTAGTTASQSVGMSIPWSPPEMFEDDPQPDVRSDIFSLAATVFTLLAGHTPFEIPGRSNSSVDLMGRIERGAITPLRRTDVPRSLLSVLQKGMSVSPLDRYPTAVEFARALQRVELELNYAQTPIDVANLELAAPVRPAAADDGADRTTARTVSTVHAQPETAPPASGDQTRLRPPAVITPRPVAPTAESTILRKPTSVPAETVIKRRPESTRPAEREAVAPRRRANLFVLIGSALAVIAVIAIVLISSNVFGVQARTGDPNGTPGDSSSDDPVGSELLPAPIMDSATASADGTQITFAWHSLLQDGESYLWNRSDDPQNVTATEQMASATVSGVSSGERVCIDVHVVGSSGQETHEALTKSCYPK